MNFVTAAVACSTQLPVVNFFVSKNPPSLRTTRHGIVEKPQRAYIWKCNASREKLVLRLDCCCSLQLHSSVNVLFGSGSRNIFFCLGARRYLTPTPA